MGWPWNNPTREEAEDAYYYYRNEYYNACYENVESKKLKKSYQNEKDNAVSQKNSYSTQKLNFEKRLAGIEEIIKMLEGTASKNKVPDEIAKVVSSVTETDKGFKSSFKSDVGKSVDFNSSFKTKSVVEDGNSSQALTSYKNEKERLANALENIKKQMNTLDDLINSLTGKINYCNEQQSILQRKMNNRSYDMAHYKQYIE